MGYRDTEFAKEIGNLKPPAALTYSQSEWDEAFAKFGKDLTDTRIYEAARWLAEEATASRAAFPMANLNNLSPAWGTVIAVAAHNREFRTACELEADGFKNAKDEAFFEADSMARQRIEGVAGQRFTAADFVQSSVDLTESWIYDTADYSGAIKPTGDLNPAVIDTTQSYSFRKAANTLWNHVRWGGWYQVTEGGLTKWIPGDRDFELLETAWGMRQESNLMNFPNMEMTEWPKLKPFERRQRSRSTGVLAIKRVGDELKPRVGTLPALSRSLSIYAIEKFSLHGTHLIDFVDAEMPLYPGLTPAMVLLGWHIVNDIATILSREVSYSTDDLTKDQVERRALVIKKKRSSKLSRRRYVSVIQLLSG